MILAERYSGMMDSKLGFIVSVFDIEIDGKGLISRTGETVHKIKFYALAFIPKIHEIISGEIVQVADFGAFVRIGPTDAVLHLSQISSSPSRVDFKSGMIFNPHFKNPLRIGSKIKSRITAATFGKGISMKVGLTCNEETLGPLE